MASVAMAQFTIVPWSPATQVKTFANIAKHYDLNWRIEMTQSVGWTCTEWVELDYFASR